VTGHFINPAPGIAYSTLALTLQATRDNPARYIALPFRFTDGSEASKIFSIFSRFFTSREKAFFTLQLHKPAATATTTI